jgi:hypothetical protein
MVKSTSFSLVPEPSSKRRLDKQIEKIYDKKALAGIAKANL